MSFHVTGQEIRVENNHTLVARLRDEGGNWHDSCIDLDEFVGNGNGNFYWGGTKFSETARNVHFAIEGGANVPVLRGELQDLGGNFNSRDLNLAERIVNNNGRFEFR